MNDRGEIELRRAKAAGLIVAAETALRAAALAHAYRADKPAATRRKLRIAAERYGAAVQNYSDAFLSRPRSEVL